MRIHVCCLQSDESGVSKDVPPLGPRPRGVRAVAGLGFLGLAAWVPFWPVSILAAWFGISHLVAAVTAYRGCPEMGAIASFVLGRRVSTVCKPWERFDQWLDGVAHA